MSVSILLLCWLGSGQAKVVAYFGNDCEFVRLTLVRLNPGCDNLHKFVLKRRPPVKKQFLIINNEAVLLFIKNGKKFHQCTKFTDVTSKVRHHEFCP